MSFGCKWFTEITYWQCNLIFNYLLKPASRNKDNNINNDDEKKKPLFALLKITMRLKYSSYSLQNGCKTRYYKKSMV